jgi:hypothetical protein
VAVTPNVFRRVSRLSVLLGIALAACSAPNTGGPMVTTTGVPGPAVTLGDFGSSAELIQALVAYGECVEQRFPIIIRFRADPFIGLSTQIGSQREDEGDLVDEVAEVCNRRLDLDRRISAYQVEHPLSSEDEDKLVAEFISCAGALSPAVAESVASANLETLDSVERFISILSPHDLSSQDLIALSDCDQEMTGPEWVFTDGYPWFTSQD